MKRKILLIIMILLACTLVVGCANKETKTVDENYTPPEGTTNWINDEVNIQVDMGEKEIGVFNKAIEKDKKLKSKYEAIALFAKQIVSGTNYMFLTKSNNDLYVIVIYETLKGNASVQTIIPFSYTNYVNENISYNKSKRTGAWEVTMPTEAIKLDEKVQSIFDTAVSNDQKVDYLPVAVLGHQIASGTHYALLAYGESKDKNKNKGIYVLTLYEDDEGNKIMDSSAYVLLDEFNE